MLKEASRQQIENELKRAVDQRQKELDAASGAQRDDCQQAFLVALQTYMAFFVDGKVPAGYRLVKVENEDDDEDDD